MKVRKNRSFLSQKIDEVFIKLKDFTFQCANFFSTKTGEVAYNINEIRHKSKDLIGSNLQLAETHLQNNNLFDAKLRYKIVLKLDKNNVQALCGLASIYFIQKKLDKAQELLKIALEFATEEAREEILELLNTINDVKLTNII
jgi:hypothetical protein